MLYKAQNTKFHVFSISFRTWLSCSSVFTLNDFNEPWSQAPALNLAKITMAKLNRKSQGSFKKISGLIFWYMKVSIPGTPGMIYWLFEGNQNIKPRTSFISLQRQIQTNWLWDYSWPYSLMPTKCIYQFPYLIFASFLMHFQCKIPTILQIVTMLFWRTGLKENDCTFLSVSFKI